MKAKKKKLYWGQIDKESALCLKKTMNFEKELLLIKKKNSKKPTQQIVNEVNAFGESNNLKVDVLEIEEKKDL